MNRGRELMKKDELEKITLYVLEEKTKTTDWHIIKAYTDPQEAEQHKTMTQAAHPWNQYRILIYD